MSEICDGRSILLLHCSRYGNGHVHIQTEDMRSVHFERQTPAKFCCPLKDLHNNACHRNSQAPELLHNVT